MAVWLYLAGTSNLCTSCWNQRVLCASKRDHKCCEKMSIWERTGIKNETEGQPKYGRLCIVPVDRMNYKKKLWKCHLICWIDAIDCNLTFIKKDPWKIEKLNFSCSHSAENPSSLGRVAPRLSGSVPLWEIWSQQRRVVEQHRPPAGKIKWLEPPKV